jgi:hypothetical protein
MKLFLSCIKSAVKIISNNACSIVPYEDTIRIEHRYYFQYNIIC